MHQGHHIMRGATRTPIHNNDDEASTISESSVLASLKAQERALDGMLLELGVSSPQMSHDENDLTEDEAKTLSMAEQELQLEMQRIDFEARNPIETEKRDAINEDCIIDTCENCSVANIYELCSPLAKQDQIEVHFKQNGVSLSPLSQPYALDYQGRVRDQADFEPLPSNMTNMTEESDLFAQ